MPPPSRRAGLLCRAVGDQIVVVHPGTGTAHCLSGVVADVWRAGDGVALPAAVSGPEAAAAVRDLVDLDLLVDAVGLSRGDAVGLSRGDAAGLSRRDVLRRGGLLAAGVGIVSIVLPEAAAAASSVMTLGPFLPGTTGSVTVPANARLVTITMTSGAGGGGSGIAPMAGGAGVVATVVIPGVLASSLGISYVVAVNGVAGTGTRAGGGGFDTGGTGGGPGALGSSGGGGGGASAVVLTGAAAGTVIAAGGGGAGGGLGTAGLPGGLVSGGTKTTQGTGNGASGTTGSGLAVVGGGGGGGGATNAAGGANGTLGGTGGSGGTSYNGVAGGATVTFTQAAAGATPGVTVTYVA